MTGRSKRVGRRDRYLRRTNASLNRVSIQNNEIILTNTFKFVLNFISKTFESFDYGLINLQFMFWNAKHFKFEVIYQCLDSTAI